MEAGADAFIVKPIEEEQSYRQQFRSSWRLIESGRSITLALERLKTGNPNSTKSSWRLSRQHHQRGDGRSGHWKNNTGRTAGIRKCHCRTRPHFT